MTSIPTYFNDFLRNIRLTENQVSDLITGHSTLRKRLNEDEDLPDIIVSTFLQGSYRRATATRPKNQKRSDVDVIVVTRLDKDKYTPEEAHDKFIPFMEKHYKGKYRIQGRSIGIELSYVDLDLVVTAAPSEVQEEILKSDSVKTVFAVEELEDWVLKKSWVSPEDRTDNQLFFGSREEAEWKTEPLYIPDREAKDWKPTDPLAQIKWTWDKNKNTNKHYVNVVKSLKWWRKESDPESKHPKSYPLEHLIGQACPDEVTSVGEGVTLTLESIVDEYVSKPTMPDHGVPEHDVFGRLTDEEYEAFYEKVKEAAGVAREALDATDTSTSVEKWRKLFGSKFPAPPKSTKKQNGFSSREEKTDISGRGTRFA